MRRASVEWKVKRPNKNAAVPAGGSEDVQDGDGRTTVMLGHLPNTCTAEALLELLDEKGFAKKYDFFYLPIDFQRHVNMGHAFINFQTSADARECIASFDGFTNWSCKSQKVCRTSYAVVQGYRANIKRQQKSSLVAEDTPEEFKPIVFDERGERIPLNEVFKEISATGTSSTSAPRPSQAERWDSWGWNDWWSDRSWDDSGSARDWYGYPKEETHSSAIHRSGGGWYERYSEDWSTGFKDSDWKDSDWKDNEASWDQARDERWEARRHSPRSDSCAEPEAESDASWPVVDQSAHQAASAKAQVQESAGEGPAAGTSGAPHTSSAPSQGQEFTGRGGSERGGGPPAAQQPEAAQCLNPGMRYMCPGCDKGFVKWSACFAHISSTPDCRKQVPELDQELLQATCRKRALEKNS